MSLILHQKYGIAGVHLRDHLFIRIIINQCLMSAGAGSVPKGKEALLKALALYEIPVLREERASIFAGMDFKIEVEGFRLFKLSQDGIVIGPFTDIDELCKWVRKG